MGLLLHKNHLVQRFNPKMWQDRPTFPTGTRYNKLIDRLIFWRTPCEKSLVL